MEPATTNLPEMATDKLNAEFKKLLDFQPANWIQILFGPLFERRMTQLSQQYHTLNDAHSTNDSTQDTTEQHAIRSLALTNRIRRSLIWWGNLHQILLGGVLFGLIGLVLFLNGDILLTLASNFTDLPHVLKIVLYSGLGTALFYATSLYLETEKSNKRSIMPRLVIAILVPIFILTIFVQAPDADNKLDMQDFRFTSESLSFICGYSANLAVGILNKLVDKASKTIDALLGVS